MHTLFFYSMKLSCSLAALWLFYRLALRNLTFYSINRWYLLGYSALSFLIPLIDIGPAFDRNAGSVPFVLQFIPSLVRYAPAMGQAPVSRVFVWSAWDSIAAILFIGMLVLLIRIVLRWMSLRQLRKKASLIADGAVKIYQVDDTIAPFSFGRAIYINRGLHTEKEWEEILLHEYVHIRQRHTIDIVLAEWLTILNWYDPFAWLIRHSIRQNLEFIADRKVLDTGFDKKDYQYHLLKVVGQAQYRLANNFNFSSLKKRIVMMNKLRSARLHLVKFLFLLPLLSVLLLAFRDQYTGLWNRTGGPVYVNAVGIVLGFPEKAPLSGVRVREKETGLQTTTDANGFYKLRIPVTQDSIRVHLDFTRDGYRDDFRERYMPSLKETVGVIDIGTLFSKTEAYPGVFIGVPYMHRLPAYPSYGDAAAALNECMRLNDDAQRFLVIQKAHPGIALFYTTEDKLKQLVIHTDGTVERYGYPDGPTIEDMEKKYGPLPQWSKPGGNTAGSGYLAHWASISAQAENEFGKLPDCVPRGFHYPSLTRFDRGKDTTAPAHKDTLRVIQKETIQGKPRDTIPTILKDSIRVNNTVVDKSPKVVLHFSSWPTQPFPLIEIDGVPSDTAGLKKLNPSQIESINVLKDSAAVAKYGLKGKNGVILIHLKKTWFIQP